MRWPGVLELLVWFYAVGQARDEPDQKKRNILDKKIFNFLRVLAWANDATEIFATKFSLSGVILAIIAARLRIIFVRVIEIIALGRLVIRGVPIMLQIMMVGMCGFAVMVGKTNCFAGAAHFS